MGDRTFIGWFIGIMEKLNKTVSRMRADGLIWTVIRVLLKLCKQPNEIQRVKNKVLTKLLSEHSGAVGYGPFVGMKLGGDVWWSSNDRITQTLGVYEKHVLEKLIKFSRKSNHTFIDIGAADGYFAVGMAFSKTFKKVYAFEISRQGRDQLHVNAKANLCENMVSVCGEANYSSLQSIIAKEDSATILVDIEGFEFELLSEEVLKLLSNCYVICELHPDRVADGCEKRDHLISTAKRFFEVSIMQRDTYNPNQFIELDEFSDEERLIALGEGREHNMKWLVLEPRT